MPRGFTLSRLSEKKNWTSSCLSCYASGMRLHKTLDKDILLKAAMVLASFLAGCLLVVLQHR